MNQDLRQRVPIGIMYVLVIASAFLCQQWPAIVLTMLFFLTSSWEFLGIEIQKKWLRVVNLIIGFIIIVAPFFFKISGTAIQVIAAIISGLFTANIILLFGKKTSLLAMAPKHLRYLAYLVIPFFLIVCELHYFERFRYVVLGAFIIIWLNDAGAYFVGKAFGKNKILEAVSPGKSCEGWIGGLLIGVIASMIISQFYKVIDLDHWLLLSIILAVFGLIGDLTESSWKRFHNIKDSGTILRGHGGFLDRLDSFIYSLPFIVLLFELYRL